MYPSRRWGTAEDGLRASHDVFVLKTWWLLQRDSTGAVLGSSHGRKHALGAGSAPEHHWGCDGRVGVVGKFEGDSTAKKKHHGAFGHESLQVGLA